MPAPNFETRKLSGWGRYPVETCRLSRPKQNSDFFNILRSGEEPSYISRGLGRSYGDAAINRGGGVISHQALNRSGSFDEKNALLDCEAGMSFADIIRRFLPRGYFLPVTPGTKFVTVGGAIAADVHGKNHHRDGSLASFIDGFELLTAQGEVLWCSPAEKPEIFWATTGGMGLTGFILKARLHLRRVETAYIRVDYQRAPNLDKVLEAMIATDNCYQYSVAWLDCLARGPSLGRSVLIRGNHASAAELGPTVHRPLAPSATPRLRLPLDLPSFTLNRFTAGAFNALYYALHRDATDCLVHLERFFYPLDKMGDWNRVYGRRGFVQYQAVLPLAAGREGLIALLERLAQSGRASFLAVLKRFGEGNAGLLSFPMQGYTLALDLPCANGFDAFLHRLDEVLLRYGGRIYLAKDALQKPETFAAGYPRLQQFRAIRQKLDPEGLLSSSLARRLKLAL